MTFIGIPKYGVQLPEAPGYSAKIAVGRAGCTQMMIIIAPVFPIYKPKGLDVPHQDLFKEALKL